MENVDGLPQRLIDAITSITKESGVYLQPLKYAILSDLNAPLGPMRVNLTFFLSQMSVMSPRPLKYQSHDSNRMFLKSTWTRPKSLTG